MRKIACLLLLVGSQITAADTTRLGDAAPSKTATMLITGEPNGLSVGIPGFQSLRECVSKIPVVTKFSSFYWDRHATARCTEKEIKLGKKYNPRNQKVGESMAIITKK